MHYDLFQRKFRISTTRLSHFDYSSSGYYYVTICTWQRLPYFGEIKKNKMILSPIGEIAHNQLINTQKIRQNVILDQWVIMPNNIHIIIIINNQKNIVETHCNASLQKRNVSTHNNDGKHIPFYRKLPWQKQKNNFGPQINNLASIIRGFKSSVKHNCNKMGFHNFYWQSRYYDHIIRSPRSLNNIRHYIQNNPRNWGKDRNHVR